MEMDSCAFDIGDSCRALTKKECEGCALYKTKEALKAGRTKAAQRIATLEPECREYILQTYHTGPRPFYKLERTCKK